MAYPPTRENLPALNRIAQRALAWMVRMIWDANHREGQQPGDPKIGGHPASCASSLHISTAIQLVLREGADFYCGKPHVAPLDHALHCLQGFFRHPDRTWFSEEDSKAVMPRLRDYSKNGEAVFQSYHAASDPDSWRTLPSGTVGIPPVNAAYLALAFRYAKDHGWDTDIPKHFWCLIGDSELREGSLMEAMPDIAERELGNVTWIIDYNRQNLDGTRIPNERGLRGSDAQRVQKTFEANGWDVIQLHHGNLRQSLFQKPGGDSFRAALESQLSDYELQAILAIKDMKFARETLQKCEVTSEFLDHISDEDLLAGMQDLGGHDLGLVIQALRDAKKDPRVPMLIVAHTLKGWGLECAAQPGNHSSMPNQDEVAALLKADGLSWDDPYNSGATWKEDGPEHQFLHQRSTWLRKDVESVENQIAENAKRTTARLAESGPLPVDFGLNYKIVPIAHTQWVWGQVAGKIVRIGTEGANNETEESWKGISELVLTMSPDVGTSTSINPAMDEKIYGPEIDENLESTLSWKERGRPELWERSGPWTRHIRFEIAEANCMSAAGSFGKMREYSGVPLLPMMTVYDFFIKRALDQLYYNVYWRSSFLLIGTPSGVSLSPEGAQHSWKSDIQFPSLITWEPAFAQEMDWILADAAARHLNQDNEDREGVLVRASTRGLAQKEFLTRLKAQARFVGQGEEVILEQIRTDVLAGGYQLVNRDQEAGYDPGDNVVSLLAMGPLIPEALAASDALLKEGVYADVYVVTSPDLLLGRFADANGGAHLHQLGLTGDLQLRPAGLSRGPIQQAEAHSLAGRFVPIVSVCDGEPGLLDNAGSFLGVPQRALGVTAFSKSGTPQDVYRYHHLDAKSIQDAAHSILEQTAARNVQLFTH